MKVYVWDEYTIQIEELRPRQVAPLSRELKSDGWKQIGDGFSPQGEILLFRKSFDWRFQAEKYLKKYNPIWIK